MDQLLSFRSNNAAWPEYPTGARNRNKNTSANLYDGRKNQKSQSPCQDSDFGFDLDTLTLKPLPAKLNALPAPPFLVSAIAEGLLRDRNSKYANIMYIVPGEADGFCAALAREQVGIEGHRRPLVLTSDSDLLVYDLVGNKSSIETSSGSNTKDIHTAVVMFFRSISFNKSNIESETALKGTQFNPSEISSRLGVDSLLTLAFAISQRPDSSLQENINYARNECKQSAAFTAFAEPYTAIQNIASTRSFRCKPICGSLIKALDYEGIIVDARVSEILCQTLMLEQNYPQGKTIDQDSHNILKMYLPSLYEDPQRSSAWECGESTRVVAYSIIGTRKYKDNQTIEYCRRGAKIVGKTVQSLKVDQIVSSLKEIMENLRNWRNNHAVLNGPFRSRLYGLFTVCEFLLQDERPMPSEDEIRSVFHGQLFEKSWEFLHLSARVQASLYSLRLLLQILEIRLHLLEASGLDNQMPVPISVMKDAEKELKYLPTLENIFSPDSDNNDDKWCDVKMNFIKRLDVKKLR